MHVSLACHWFIYWSRWIESVCPGHIQQRKWFQGQTYEKLSWVWMSVAGHIHIKEQRKSSATKMQTLKPENIETVCSFFPPCCIFYFLQCLWDTCPIKHTPRSYCKPSTVRLSEAWVLLWFHSLMCLSTWSPASGVSKVVVSVVNKALLAKEWGGGSWVLIAQPHFLVFLSLSSMGMKFDHFASWLFSQVQVCCWASHPWWPVSL